ncbi:TPA: hypothetical protein DDW35_12790 [Candidatus Sumerlaeota bacterium]|jgi:cytidylate kinase|nr:hypothetical protein [Candidatus Sumerlaeota bacterium]
MKYIEAMVDEQIKKWEQEHHGGWNPTPEGCGPASKPVIAITPRFGCGSRVVSDLLHRRTGYEIYGFKLIDKVAESMHARRRLIDCLDQRDRSYILNLVDGALSGRHVDRADYIRGLMEVVSVFVQEGGCILLGRGAPFLVPQDAGIRVLLTASPKTRIKNLMEFYSISAEEAETRMVQSDLEREEFSKMYYGKDPWDPAHYDMAINMDRITPETAAGSILQALERLRCEKKAHRLHAMEGDVINLVNRQVEKWERETHHERVAMWGEAPDETAPPNAQHAPVVAFSPQFCSGSRYVADELHTRLGYEIFGYKIIDKVAEDMHLSPRIIDHLDHRARSAIQTFIDRFVSQQPVNPHQYFISLAKMIRALVMRGGVILIGRGSTFLVEEGEGLRIRMIASMERRLENMKTFYKIEGKPAEENLLKGDKQRAEFIEQYYHTNVDDICQFDMVFNMDRLMPCAVADAVRRALEPLMF